VAAVPPACSGRPVEDAFTGAVGADAGIGTDENKLPGTRRPGRSKRGGGGTGGCRAEPVAGSSIMGAKRPDLVAARRRRRTVGCLRMGAAISPEAAVVLAATATVVGAPLLAAVAVPPADEGSAPAHTDPPSPAAAPFGVGEALPPLPAPLPLPVPPEARGESTRTGTKRPDRRAAWRVAGRRAVLAVELGVRAVAGSAAVGAAVVEASAGTVVGETVVSARKATAISSGWRRRSEVCDPLRRTDRGRRACGGPIREGSTESDGNAPDAGRVFAGAGKHCVGRAGLSLSPGDVPTSGNAESRSGAGGGGGGGALR